jgi:cholesterol transport system auxiliary component
VEATGTPDGSTALYYRLAYANAQQLRPYAQARWSQPPAQLLQQRLRDHLGQRRAVLMAADAALAPASDATTPPQRTTILRAELEEFSHVFTSHDASAGLLRLRATLVRPHLRGEQLLGQRVFVVQIPAPSPDARGAAIALALGASQVADELAQWVDGLSKP